MTGDLRPRTPEELLRELEPLLAAQLDRHHSQAAEWFPHEYVPYELGRTFVKEPWTQDDSGLPDIAKIAMELNLLTEDNLPYYTLALTRTFGHTEAWDVWVRRWTAEEGRHSIVLRDYLTVTRGIDPKELEVQRMDMVQRGFYPDFATQLTPLDGLVYTTLQELATRISHRNTGTVSADEGALRVLQRIATDENLHYLFYRGVTDAAIELDPSMVVLAIDRQVRGFAMPGTGIADFPTHAARIAKVGIYDFVEHHDHILMPLVLRHWKLEGLEGLSGEADEARERVLKYIARVGLAAGRLRERRAARQELVGST